MERPAPTRWWPRCCSRAFIGTTKNPAIAPINTMITIAAQIWCTKIIESTVRPMAIPSGITRIERSSATQSEARTARSEEHTSELQSHLNLVCRLLLEKKKKLTNSYILYKEKIKKNKII